MACHLGRTCSVTNSSTLWPSMRASSSNCSGMNTSAGSVGPRRKAPLEIFLSLDVLMRTTPLPSGPFKEGGGTHATTDAHGHHAIAGFPALHFVEQRRRELRAG